MLNMDNKYLIATLLVLSVVVDNVAGEKTYYSYELKTNSVDDGNKIVTKIIESKYDSNKLHNPRVTHETLVQPSRSAFNRYISRNQVQTNQIGTGLEGRPSGMLTSLLNRFRGPYGLRRGYSTKARTVESPALSVDSGGKASSSLAHEFAKLLDVKQGHYADIYDQIDRKGNPPPTTRRPADAIEDSVRKMVHSVFNNRNHNQNQNQHQHTAQTGQSHQGGHNRFFHLHRHSSSSSNNDNSNHNSNNKNGH